MSDIMMNTKESLSGKYWVFHQADEDKVMHLCQSYGLPEFIARMLVQRGVTPENLEEFLRPTLRDHFPDPFVLKGMEAFADDITNYIMEGKVIGVLADFDVDGSTSAALLLRFLRYLGLNPPLYIPDRLNEGYGPSKQAMQSLKSQGADFVIIADCGTTSFDPIQYAHDIGLRIAIFDHHEAEEKLPVADHIINPKQKDDISGLTMLAACGVTFLACVAMNKVLREKGFYQQIGRVEAPLKSWIDLVGLGTVCDMVPLQGVNRLFVKTGFSQMASYANKGIQSLCKIGKVEEAPNPKDAGWSIGPRINAGSRVHKSDLGAKLLSTDDQDEAISIAMALDECNSERKKIQADMMHVALNKVEFLKGNHEKFILVEDESFHSGLSGLVAGRLKERYGKPAMVVTYVENEDGILEGRGSGRSVKGVNLADIFIAARNENILIKGGGHAMAGGFTLMPDMIDKFRAFITEYLDTHPLDLSEEKKIYIDSHAAIRSAKPQFVKLLQDNVGPFGVGNPEPVFYLSSIRIAQADILKDKHIRMNLTEPEGGSRMKAMMFNGVETPLGKFILKNYNHRYFDFVGQFVINSWQGKDSVEFHIMDGAEAIQNIESADKILERAVL